MAKSDFSFPLFHLFILWKAPVVFHGGAVWAVAEVKRDMVPDSVLATFSALGPNPIFRVVVRLMDRSWMPRWDDATIPDPVRNRIWSYVRKERRK